MITLAEIRLLAYLGLAAACFIGYGLFIKHERDIGAASVQAKWDQASAKQVLADQQKSLVLAEQATLLRKARDAEKDRIDARLADALGMLRNRPDRVLSVAAAASCVGATGRELSGPDADFLVRLAAEADRLRAEVAEQAAWIDAVIKGTK